MPVSISGNTGITFPDGSLQTAAASPLVLRNRIINGDMRIDQRGAVNVAASAGNTYVACDRFTLTNYWGTGQVNTAKSTIAPSGFTNSVSLTVASAAPMNGSTGYSAPFWQAIEGFNIADAYTSSVTLSFWVRSSVTGTYSITFSNDSSVAINAATRLYVANYTISLANTWEQKTITVNLATGFASGTWNVSNGTGLCIAWNLGSESNRKGNAFLNTWGTLGSTVDIQSASQVNWISNAGATFYLTGVQLEQNTTATPFERRLYGQELANCQRYYWKIASDGTATGFPAIGSGVVNGSTTSYIYVKYPITMRTSPTASYNGTITIHDGSAGATVSSTSANYPGLDSMFWVFNHSAGLVASRGAIAYFQNSTSNFIQATAEL